MHQKNAFIGQAPAGLGSSWEGHKRGRGEGGHTPHILASSHAVLDKSIHSTVFELSFCVHVLADKSWRGQLAQHAVVVDKAWPCCWRRCNIIATYLKLTFICKRCYLLYILSNTASLVLAVFKRLWSAKVKRTRLHGPAASLWALMLVILSLSTSTKGANISLYIISFSCHTITVDPIRKHKLNSVTVTPHSAYTMLNVCRLRLTKTVTISVRYLNIFPSLRGWTKHPSYYPDLSAHFLMPKKLSKHWRQRHWSYFWWRTGI